MALRLPLKLLLNWRGSCCCLGLGLGLGRIRNRTTASSSAYSGSNLFVGGLSYDTNEHGDVVAVKVICHPLTGKSKGFGFVKFSTHNQAATALQKMNGA